MRTHATPLPPGSPIPARVSAVAQLLPVSIPDIVHGIAGNNPQQRIADFDLHYMPDGVPTQEVSVQGHADEHRSDLRETADGISRGVSDVFAYLTYNTTSQNEAKKLFQSSIMYAFCVLYIYIIFIIYYINYRYFIHYDFYLFSAAL
jgi:hypothetical protein